jgi:NAD(P)-dependent dehydrogenase (short-subunit alcohol dehydrogenase family)
MGMDQVRRVAVVTGAGRGIGFAAARRLAQAGMDIGICYIRDDLVRSACDALTTAGFTAHGVECDVRDEAQVRRMIEHFDRLFGRIDVVVNSAGILETGDGSTVTVEQMSLDTWSRVIAVNLTGPFLVCREAIPVLKRGAWGRIVNVASRAGRTYAGPGAYSASKGGLIALSRVLAGELGPFGITVNCVAPSRVPTELTAGASSPAVIARKLAETPLGRLATTDDVAGAVAYLASDDASFVTGAIIDVTGGSFMPS